MSDHAPRLFEDGDGWTATCNTCDWQSTSAVGKWQAAQEADIHTAVKAGRSWPCPRGETHVDPEHEGCELAVCPYCHLTVDVRPSYISRREWRYMPHLLVLDGDDMDLTDLAGWWETTKAAVEGGPDAVRRLNYQTRVRVMSEEYREQKRSAS